jgi:hypothetical protein
MLRATDIARNLSYYKRGDVREAIAMQCRGKEVAVKYQDRFGKRPDIIVYPDDVLSFAKRKATSFHISEETWSNPLQLSTGLRRQELDELRIAWDLVLDVDFPEWEATKEIAAALVGALKQEGLPSKAITAKFSGNKGFHIAVPWEAFPEVVVGPEGDDIITSDLFPDGARGVVEYLVHCIDGPANDYALSEQLVRRFGRETLKPLLNPVCANPGCARKAPADAVEGNEFVCPACEWRGHSEEVGVSCPRCAEQGRRTLLAPVSRAKERRCEACGSREFRDKLDLSVDTMLVTSRHMYRAAYSLHEKSGLASVPVELDAIKDFERSKAEPELVTVSLPFLDRDVPPECGQQLLSKGIAFQPLGAEEKKDYSKVEWDGDAAREELFPPPITKMLAGLKDGRKRALFVLTNFLRSVGWSVEMVEVRLLAWNEANKRVGGEGLRETEIQGHLRYQKDKEPALPPNFDNDMYYKDLGVLEHDELSRRVKNPVQYVRLKRKQAGKDR